MKLAARSWVPEHSHCDACSASKAVLHIPATLGRPREFDVDVTLIVRLPDVGEPLHQLAVELDGKLPWQRRIPCHRPGPADGLDTIAAFAW